MDRSTRTLATALLAAAWAVSAHAGRPLQTEDAGVLERGQCEIEGATARATAFGARARETSLQFGCGVGWNSQLALNAATAKADGERARGLALVGKTGLWTSGDAGLTLAWALQWARPDGDPWRHAATDLNLAYSRPLPAALTLHANVGHARDETGHQRSTSWGMALEHAGFGALAPMAEVFGDDRQAPWWNLGLRLTAAPDQAYVDLSWGRQITGGRPRLVTLGFKLVL